MDNKTRKRLFDALLTEAEINPTQFYRLFHALEGAPYIKLGSVRVTHNRPEAPLVLTAKYNGDDQLGHARKGRRHVKPEALDAAIRVYEDISRISGINFTRVLPSLDDGECIGYANIGKRRDSSMPLILSETKVYK